MLQEHFIKICCVSCEIKFSRVVSTEILGVSEEVQKLNNELYEVNS